MGSSPRAVPDIKRASVEKILRGLVAIDSVNPYESGGSGEQEIAEDIASRLKGLGLRVAMQDVVDRRPNVLGVLEGAGRGPALILNGHLDTVGVEGMVGDPFEPRVDAEGNLHGRGACDMKGSLAAMIAALGWVVGRGLRLRGDLIFTGAVDEEYLARGTRQIAKRVRADAAIVGEPTRLQIAIAHKGFAWLRIAIEGRAAHGSVPEKGVDAIEKMAKLVVSLEKLRRGHRLQRHPLLGTPKIHTSTVRGGTEWAVIPESCALEIERRNLPGETESSVLEEIRSLVARVAEDDPEFKARVSLETFLPPLEESKDATIVRTLRRAVRLTDGRSPRLIGVPYWTDAATLKSEGGIPTCLFGPGDIALAHSADEHVSLDEVTRAAKAYAVVARGFCGVEDE